MKLSTPEVKRFWSYVSKDSNDGCWMWTSFTGPRGYGRFFISRKTSGLKQRLFTAHRIAWELLQGPIPAGLQLDHLCRVHGCVNPAHLEIVTCKENILRGESLSAKNAKKTHCPRGHALAGDNLYLYRGRRGCDACRRAYRIAHA